MVQDTEEIRKSNLIAKSVEFSKSPKVIKYFELAESAEPVDGSSSIQFLLNMFRNSHL